MMSFDNLVITDILHAATLLFQLRLTLNCVYDNLGCQGHIMLLTTDDHDVKSSVNSNFIKEELIFN